MEFVDFKAVFQQHVTGMLNSCDTLFLSDVGKDEVWNTYLDSFPAGTNEVYRERREFDCSCCRHFIKNFGNVISIVDNQVVSIWDFQVGDDKYQTVINALSTLVKSQPIRDVFISKDSAFGTDFTHEQLENKTVHTWHHLRVVLPNKFVTRSSESKETIMGQYRDTKKVFKRSLDEISKDSIETVLELISQKSLYRGEEWQGPLKTFLKKHNEYHSLQNGQWDNFCWIESVNIGPAIGKIKNHSIGTLLTDITEGVELDEAVRRYEKIVAPTNYKRPKAIFTKRMIEDAQKKVEELGLTESLPRRLATADDITVNNVLFSNKDQSKITSGNAFDELQKDVTVNPKKLSKVEEVNIETFISDVLPKVNNIELLFENRLSSNLFSLIAPKDGQSKSMFKWENGFSWAYNGNIADSMKERVKAAGGNVEGVLRFSLQWNEGGDNLNDFDAHCVEPNGNEIWFRNKGRQHYSTGMLDVDIINPIPDQVAVENITWSILEKMQEGIYHFFVHNFSHHGGRSGFAAEIEYDGQIHSFEYRHDILEGRCVTVAKIKFTRSGGIEFIESLDSSLSSKEVFGIKTNQFIPVSLMMYSPNYWDNQQGIGNRHYFFTLKGCKNSDSPNGFFNEFLREDLMAHKKVFEALGGKMKVEPSDNQLSGLGFSSTKRNSVLCKVSGNFTRTLKILF